MGKPYSQDFRARVITAVDGGIGVLRTADRRGSTMVHAFTISQVATSGRLPHGISSRRRPLAPEPSAGGISVASDEEDDEEDIDKGFDYQNS